MMERRLIKILKDDLSFLTSIKAYSSFYFERNLTMPGEFQIVLGIKYAEYFKEDYYIYLSRKKAFIIEIVIEDEKKNTITVKGKDVKSILNRRITIPPTGQAYQTLTANGETLIKNLVNLNCINPVDASRVIPGLVMAANQNRGETALWNSRYKNLTKEAENIATLTGLGWTVEVDQVNRQLIFDVVKGVDRSHGQSINSPVTFSKKFKNMKNALRSVNTGNYKNYAYVAGQGEGAAREVVTVTNGDDISGLKRRELVVDARDLSTTDGLYSRGNTKLTETVIVKSSEMEITNNNFIYEEDWDLGDIVTVQTSTGYESQQVTEIREIYESAETIEITTGNPSKTVAAKIKEISTETNELV
jgi:hypothetical protein